ncbi:MAG: IS4 family transposase [candidate division KSB1 bacterium]|nr:IS4 family transposase [candidate division KSB1 bacterium]
MSDNRRRYHAVRMALNELYPTEPQGNLARHLNTLAGLISGIIGSKSVHLSKVAQKVPGEAKTESRVKRFSRWVDNAGIEFEVYFLPFAQALLACLAQWPLVLVMDGSAVGRGCVTLIVNVVYRQRALPIAWVVIKGSKGHFPEETHVALLQQVHELVPEDARVVFLGDGEFDGTTLQATVNEWGWEYVSRTAENITLCKDGKDFSYADLGVQPGQCIGVPGVTFTSKAYGPVLAIAWWEEGYKEPIYLVTNMALAEEACRWYTKRAHIETFFSDQKSRGFQLHKSHLADPTRLARLMIAACLAYIWMIFLGVKAIQEGWDKIIHRTDRCDVSLFQLGLNLLEHFLNESLPILVSFQVWEAGCFVCA